MSKSKLLEFGNVRRTKERLTTILDTAAINAIEVEIRRNVTALYDLGIRHYRFAKVLPAVHWRQKVSRLYYGAYNASRAVRLEVTGDFSTDSSDHKKVGQQTENFPNGSTFANKLVVLREDRNLADYDHLARASDLASPTIEHLEMVSSYLHEVRVYLIGRGVQIRSQP